MLIKNYVYDTQSAPADAGKTFIIEGVSNVVIHHLPYFGPANGPRFEGPDMPTNWIEQSQPSGPTDSFYFVDYTDKGNVRCRLKVTAYAYICNDDGKTIHKVGT